MEINFVDQFNQGNPKEIPIFYTNEGFLKWYKEKCNKSQGQIILDQLRYTQMEKEIMSEQRQYLQCQNNSNQITKLILQFNQAKLTNLDIINIQYLLNQLSQLKYITIYSKYYEVYSQLHSIFIRQSNHHDINITLINHDNLNNSMNSMNNNNDNILIDKLKGLKLLNSQYSKCNYNNWIGQLKNIEELKLVISLNEENKIYDFTNQSQNLQNLLSFSITLLKFISQRDFNALKQIESQLDDDNNNNMIISNNNNNNNINLMDVQPNEYVQITLNKIIEMNKLQKLTLNISKLLKNIDDFKLLNQALSFKSNLLRLTINLSYHRIIYNIADILQLNSNLSKISLNCNSCTSFIFHPINSIYPYQSSSQQQQQQQSQYQQYKQIQIRDQFKYKQLQELKLNLNFTKSQLVNELIKFLIQQRDTLSNTLTNLTLELNCIYPNLCIYNIGQLLSKLNNLQNLKFQCHNSNLDIMRDNIYLLRQLTQLKNLKNLTFHMKVTSINYDYNQLIQILLQQCDNVEINIYKSLGLCMINKSNIAIFTIKTDFINGNANANGNGGGNANSNGNGVQDKQIEQNNLLEYIITLFSKIKTIQQIFIQISELEQIQQQEQEQLEDIQQFLNNLYNFKQLEVLNINLYKYSMNNIKYLLSKILIVLKEFKLMKVFSIQNRNFFQNDFRHEYSNLLINSIIHNQFLKKINIENYSCQMYDDYQLLYLQNLLNYKNKYANILIPQIRAISSIWPNSIRKSIITDLVTTFFV